MSVAPGDRVERYARNLALALVAILVIPVLRPPAADARWPRSARRAAGILPSVATADGPGPALAGHVAARPAPTRSPHANAGGRQPAPSLIPTANLPVALPLPGAAEIAIPGLGVGGDPSDYALWFARQGVNGGPARWNPCQTIKVAGGPPLTNAILSELTVITRLRFQPVLAGGDIVVSWGSTPAALATTNDSTASGWIVHAAVTLSHDAAPRLATILRHELGHALGLAHSRELTEVMTPGTSATEYSSGDVAGLRQVGAAAGPCPPPGAPASPGFIPAVSLLPFESFVCRSGMPPVTDPR